MKLYDFEAWDKHHRSVGLRDLESDEVFFKQKFQEIQKGWIVVDVGARIGYYTINAGLLVGSNGKVLSFEPHPETFRVLKMNVALYKLENVIPVCKALGSKTGKVKLYEGLDSGATSVMPSPPLTKLDRNRLRIWFEFLKSGNILKPILKRREPPIYVPIDTLGKAASEKNLGKIDLVKIDVQGFELDVLKGSLNILETDKPILLVEIHDKRNPRTEALYELLRNLGYHLKVQERLQEPSLGTVYLAAHHPANAH